LIWGGEPTIRITGTGIGGRNQELCLRIAFCLKEFSQYKDKILFSSFGTDGIDGPTDSAGGIVFCDSVQKINDLIKNHQEYSSAEDLLRNNDSYTALNLIDGLIKTGPTGTNLNDLSFFVYD
jgi:hydroxypyruvate reductase